ncbi:hypothetical protein AB0H43_34240 [Hamadaea sp. NPDC050747]|uniref:hypothetical protein n=1 Tax=Hamadaea sp. NPDC050747 TaxID=3155789 RepID=UPI00340F4BD9
MNTDPSTNMVVFEIPGYPEPFISSGPTQADDCVQQAWFAVPVERRAAADVSRIYSEWQPSAVDEDFIGRTFPRAAVTYSFDRPGPGGWEAAYAEVRQTMEQAERQHAAAQAVDNMEHVAENGQLLPILWSWSSPTIDLLQHLPHRDVVPGRLHVTVAAVATTPQGRIGMNHLTHAKLGTQPFEEVLATAYGALVSGLRVDVGEDRERPDRGRFLTLRREGAFASSALALPDFHDQMSRTLGADHLVVALPDPDTILVTRQDSGWVEYLERCVLDSPYAAGEIVPSLVALEPAGIRLLVERHERLSPAA